MLSLRLPHENYFGQAIAAAPGTHAAAVELITHHAPDRTSRVLDVGCHTGALVGRLHDAGYKNVEGTDLAKKLEGCPFPFTPADLNEPFEQHFSGKSFDVVVASEVISSSHFGEEGGFPPGRKSDSSWVCRFSKG